MHGPVRQYVRQHLPERYASVLEVGSLDINGGVRDLLYPETEYVGVDVQAGPGVDVVADFASYWHPQPVDVILCLEVLEHASQWREIIASAVRNLKNDGTLILTCATTGRERHSARSGGPIQSDEFYENVEKGDLDAEFEKHFRTYHSEVIFHDLRACGAGERVAT